MANAPLGAKSLGCLLCRLGLRFDGGGASFNLFDDVIDHRVIAQLVALFSRKIDHARPVAPAGKAHIPSSVPHRGH